MKRKKKVIFLRDHRDPAKPREDLDPQTTSHGGLAGLYELALRRFKTVIYLLTILPLYVLGALLIGASLVPGILLFRWTLEFSGKFHWLIRDLELGTALGTGFFLYGFTIILLVPAANFILRSRPKEARGPYYSVDFLQWYIHNSLTYLVRYTFLEFITPTPFNILFYRLMGMKIGRSTQINTAFVSDPALIEMGHHVTIGGSATLCAHYGMGGYLILSPVRIGDHATIGLKASVMGGVDIGAGAKVLPHSVVLPKTKIPPGETWGGVPAVKLDLASKKK